MGTRRELWKGTGEGQRVEMGGEVRKEGQREKQQDRTPVRTGARPWIRRKETKREHDMTIHSYKGEV